jgi:hypothetical protein
LSVPWQVLGGFPSPPHHQVEILAAPLRQAAHCDLRRFHEQESQHRTPLFGDMPQESPIPLDSSSGTCPR